MSQRGRVEVQIERNQRGDQAHGQRGDLSGVVHMRITSLFLQFLRLFQYIEAEYARQLLFNKIVG